MYTQCIQHQEATLPTPPGIEARNALLHCGFQEIPTDVTGEVPIAPCLRFHPSVTTLTVCNQKGHEMALPLSRKNWRV